MPQSESVLLSGIAVLAGGGIAYVVAHLLRQNHIRKFGPPPAGSGTKTFGLFGMWCLVFGVAAFVSREALALVLVGAVVLSQVVGFKVRTWSRWQRFRDAATSAVLFCASIASVWYLAWPA